MQVPQGYALQESAGIWPLRVAQKIAKRFTSFHHAEVIDWPEDCEFHADLPPDSPCRITWGNTFFYVGQNHPHAEAVNNG